MRLSSFEQRSESVFDYNQTQNEQPVTLAQRCQDFECALANGEQRQQAATVAPADNQTQKEQLITLTQRCQALDLFLANNE